MDINTGETSGCCADNSCGCHIDAYATSQECPGCGKRLRLTGKALQFEFRLTCGSCGYAGPLLSPQEIGDLI